MKRHAANIITLSRIPLSLCLLLPMNKWIFLVVYALCGLTDLLDGMIARKFKLQSALGARLDSVADLFMVGVIVLKLFERGLITYFLPWLIAITVIRLTSMLVVYIKHKKFGVLHTWANKVTGLLLFLVLPLTELISNHIAGWVVTAVALFAALEELFINIKDKTFIPDKRYWFDKKSAQP
jgi:CDP-diacylglycerol--glycerol-3-phosphate 3-phosphatidyltransferase